MPLQKFILIYEAMFDLLGSHLGFPKDILMIVLCRFIHGLEVVIDKKPCS